MNILFVLYIGFDRTGPSVHLLTDIIEQCLIAGHNVRMIVRNRGGEDPDVPGKLQKYDNLKCDIIKDGKLVKAALVKRYLKDIKYAFKCRKIYKNYKDTDIVFLQSCTAAIFPMTLLKRTLRKPVLFNVQNIFPIDALAINKLSKKGIKGLAFYVFRKMQQIAYRMSDRIVTISEDMKQTLIDENVPPEKISVIHNWSYSDDAVDIKDEDNLFLNTHKVDEKLFRVVFSGNMGAQVNARQIAEAAELLKDEEQIHFFIIGDGGNMPYLKRLAEEKKLMNMSFYPYQPVEFAPHNYAMAHVNINTLPKGIVYTCLPSKTAITLNAARPMVVSMEKDSWFAKELAKVDKCIVVDVNDAEGYKNAILHFYKNNIKENSENSREIFKQLFSKENAKQYEKVLSEMESGK